MLALFFAAAGQVALVAVLLGAGLPALFAVGVRSFAVAGNSADAGRSGGVPVPVLRSFGVLCFAIVITAVAIGLTIIIATGFGQQVSFEHIIPTFVEKG